MTSPLTTIGARSIRLEMLNIGDEITLTTTDRFRFTFRMESPFFSEVSTVRTETRSSERHGARFLPLKRDHRCFLTPKTPLRLVNGNSSARQPSYMITVGKRVYFDCLTPNELGQYYEFELATITSIVMRHCGTQAVDEDADTTEYLLSP